MKTGTEKMEFYERLFESASKKLIQDLNNVYINDINIMNRVCQSVNNIITETENLSKEDLIFKIQDDIRELYCAFENCQDEVVCDTDYHLVCKNLMEVFFRRHNSAAENFFFRSKYYSVVMSAINIVIQRNAKRLNDDVLKFAPETYKLEVPAI